MRVTFVFENTDSVELDERDIVGIALIGNIIVAEIPKRKNELFYEFGFQDRKVELFERFKRNDITQIDICQNGRRITAKTTYDPLAQEDYVRRSQRTRVLPTGNLEIVIEKE